MDTSAQERYRQDGNRAGKAQGEETVSLCLVFSFGCFHFFRLEAFMWKSQHAQVMHHTHHRPSGCSGIPWASVKSHSNSIVYIAPKNRNENKCFSAFPRLFFRHANTQLHSNTEVRRVHVYIFAIYSVYGIVAVSSWRFRERTFVSFVDFVQFITCKIY